METFLKANPGLNSRFDKYLKFEDYTPEELTQIALTMLEQEEYHLSPEAHGHLEQYLHFLHEFRDKYFGNARSVRNVVTEIIKNQNLRLAALPERLRENEDLRLLLPDDVASLKTDKSNFLFNKKTIGFKQSREGSS